MDAAATMTMADEALMRRLLMTIRLAVRLRRPLKNRTIRLRATTIGSKPTILTGC
jgi:hypothetical protein